ncbi:hypothetical protein NDU88_001188 [Pleurodeles waltl]|uniref:Uncharacterized protein n=1 Tax=Pleurodeles waltl TaxID=8319 RepID=A0AAV7S6R4_PLEWA|nr:hypothetical protein NDU88_001188 [Pleurodeles waltl]
MGGGSHVRFQKKGLPSVNKKRLKWLQREVLSICGPKGRWSAGMAGRSEDNRPLYRRRAADQKPVPKGTGYVPGIRKWTCQSPYHKNKRRTTNAAILGVKIKRKRKGTGTVIRN